MTDKRTLNLVQLLRGLASLFVLLMHTTIILRDAGGGNFLGGFFAFGGAGVDIFFVLSGFIITYTSAHALGSAKNFSVFLRRRFIRIFPVYWIIITIFLALQIALPSFYRTHYDLNILNLVRTYLLFPGHNMINGVSWTLSYELFFYFLFSLAFLIRDHQVLFVFAVLYIALLIGLPVAGYQPEYSGNWLNLIGFPMNTEFFMGILAALIIPKISFRTALVFLTAGSIAFLVSGILNNAGFSVLPSTFNRVIIFGIPSFFIIAGVVRYEKERSTNIHNIFIGLGEASYSLYLLHLPLVVACIKIISRFITKPGGFIMHISVLCMVVLICGLSMLFFKKIEKPMINILNRKNRLRTTPPALESGAN